MIINFHNFHIWNYFCKCSKIWNVAIYLHKTSLSKFNFNYCLHDHAQAVDTLIYETGLLARFFFLKKLTVHPLWMYKDFIFVYLVPFNFSWYLWKKSWWFPNGFFESWSMCDGQLIWFQSRLLLLPTWCLLLMHRKSDH